MLLALVLALTPAILAAVSADTTPTVDAIPAGVPDFSFAGYHRGDAPLPNVAVTSNVRDYGARGDGETDDTAAFRQAIDAAKAGAIDIPPGRYVISDVLEIRKPNVVLRGAGPDKTTLYFPKYLNDVRPNWGATTGGQRTSNYSWAGGYIWFKGSYQSVDLANVVDEARTGERRLVVSDTTRLSVGQDVDIFVQDDPENTLAAHLYANDPGSTSKLLGRTKATLTTKIVAIEAGEKPVITIDRPLRFDLKSQWKPRVRQFKPTVTESGIEGVRFEFPNVPYNGHFTELGHNPVAFEAVAHCWVRNIEIVNADSGPMINGRFCTITDLVYRSERKQDGASKATGHHGVYIGDDDNRFINFRFDQRFIHDISVSKCAGNVIGPGSGVDLCFDHHRRAPYANLFTDIDLGAGTRPWSSGGGDDLGKHTAAGETFWNLRAARPLSMPPEKFGPNGGLHVFFEPPAGIPNLYEYQRQQRKATAK